MSEEVIDREFWLLRAEAWDSKVTFGMKHGMVEVAVQSLMGELDCLENAEQYP